MLEGMRDNGDRDTQIPKIRDRQASAVQSNRSTQNDQPGLL